MDGLMSTERLANMPGLEGKHNDVLFRSGAHLAKSNVIYFGGDIQNYKECMKDAKYSKWSLDYTADLLSNRFTESNVWIVKPCAMQENTYSLYKNFVTSGLYGVPSHSRGQKSWHHLYLLMKHSLELLQVNYPGSDTMSLLDCPVIIIGFSKGCVVLNQLIYDMKDDDNEELRGFMNRVQVMYWLDGGHGGTGNTWITSEDVLSVILTHGITIETHVTPYQIKDRARPWIAKEYKTFVDKLKKLGVTVQNYTHFKNSPRSLENHFLVLETF